MLLPLSPLSRPRRRAPAAVLLLATCLLGAASPAASAPPLSPLAPLAPVTAEPPRTQPCPAGLPATTRCLGGRDHLGAGYWIAVPAPWNGVLVLHAHGGPELDEPRPEHGARELQRWSALVQAGYAWAGSIYRQAGVEVLAAAEDTEHLRQIVVAEVALPRRIILHGHGWGAGVAVRAAARHTTPDLQGPRRGQPSFDAVLLTSGQLGGLRGLDVLLDLRVVYQALCQNHPRPDEPAYPLWMGLPVDSRLTRTELAQRVDDCTGLRRPAGQRSAAQQAALQTITRVTGIAPAALLDRLEWATWQFRDIVRRKLGGRNPFGNEGVRYQGMADDEAFNARVPRYQADTAAQAELGRDTEPSGPIHRPMLSLHGIDDPVAFVELETEWRTTMTAAGSADQLVQVYSRDAGHDDTSHALVLGALQALLAWVEHGDPPTPAALAARCRQLSRQVAQDCRIEPDYQPRALSTRVPERRRAVPEMFRKPSTQTTILPVLPPPVMPPPVVTAPPVTAAPAAGPNDARAAPRPGQSDREPGSDPR